MEEKKIKGKQKVKNIKKKEPNKRKNEQNNKLAEENTKLNEKLLRVMAEMQNMKRRNEEEIINSTPGFGYFHANDSTEFSKG